ncbi:MAG: S8 family serine peptidase [Candidatus Eisenbacteria bacterium]
MKCSAFAALMVFMSGALLAGQAAAEDCSPDRFVIQFVDDVVLSIPDSIIMTGVPTVDTLNVLYQVVFAESVFVRPSEMSQTDSILYDSLGLGRTYLFSTHHPIVDSSLVAEYAADHAVVLAELDCEFHAVSAVFPNDPFFGFQWGFHNDTLNAGWPDADKNAPEGWWLQQETVLMAILDTGVDRDHDDLSTRIWCNLDEAGGDWGVDDDGNGYVDDIWGWNWVQDSPNTWDNHGHGTHVAGIASAWPNNNTGVAGQGWSYQSVMALKVLDENADGNSAWISQGIFYAANKDAKVINLSLGSYNPSAVIRQGIDFAYGKGCVVVAAIGNDDCSLPFFPAAYDNVIAVGGTDSNDNRAWFSNHGSYIDVVAPGADIYSTWPGDSYAWESGTSMAAPHVSGLAALILGARPGLDNEWVRFIIRNTSDDEIGDLVEDIAGFDDYFGYGRINDYSALAYSIYYPAYIPLLENVRLSCASDHTTFMMGHTHQPCEERWEAVGVRMPENPDFEMTLWDSVGGWFSAGTPEEPVEFIVMHRRSSDFSTVLVDAERDCGKYAIEWATPFACLHPLPWMDSEFGPFQWPSAHVVQICCIQIQECCWYEINLDHSDPADLGMALFRPHSDPDARYDRWAAVAIADENGPEGSEVLAYQADTTAWHALAIWSNNGRHASYMIRFPQATGVSEQTDLSPGSVLTLEQNLPNPFNPMTEIRYTVPAFGRVSLCIHDISGRLVTALIDGAMPAGSHSALWDGRDAAGAEAASGVYFVRLRDGEGVLTRKITLVR